MAEIQHSHELCESVQYISICLVLALTLKIISSSASPRSTIYLGLIMGDVSSIYQP